MSTYPDPRTGAPNIVRFGTPFNSFTTAVVINAAGAGDNTIISAVAGKSIYVYRAILTTGGATNITIKDGASTALSGAMPFNQGGIIILDMSGDAWFTTTAGNAFIINSSNAVQLSGTIYYFQA